jgi:hypothetical protein
MGYNKKGPQCGPFLLASLMCESWNRVLEWLQETAALWAVASGPPTE